jgi:hypothetical protein
MKLINLLLGTTDDTRQIDPGRRRVLKVGAAGAGGIVLAPLFAFTGGAATSSGVIASSSSSSSSSAVALAFKAKMTATTGLSLPQLAQSGQAFWVAFGTYFNSWSVIASSNPDITVETAVKIMEAKASTVATSFTRINQFQIASKTLGSKSTELSDYIINRNRVIMDKKLNLKRLAEAIKLKLPEEQRLLAEINTYECWKRDGIPFDRIPGSKIEIDTALNKQIEDLRHKLNEIENFKTEEKRLRVEVESDSSEVASLCDSYRLATRKWHKNKTNGTRMLAELLNPSKN